MTTTFDVTLFYRENHEKFKISLQQLGLMVLISSINGINNYTVCQQDLIKLTGFKKAYIRRLIEPLIDQNLIEIIKIGTVNNYKITLSKGSPMIPNDKTKGSHRIPNSDNRDHIGSLQRDHIGSLSTDHTINIKERENRIREKKEKKALVADAPAGAAAMEDICTLTLMEKKDMTEEGLEVFEHWKLRMNHPRARIDKKRNSVILAALKMGYSVEELKEAINGCARSEWHMGQNDRRMIYDDIELILRDAKHIDSFMKYNVSKDSLDEWKKPVELTRAQNSVASFMERLDARKWAE